MDQYFLLAVNYQLNSRFHLEKAIIIIHSNNNFLWVKDFRSLAYNNLEEAFLNNNNNHFSNKHFRLEDSVVEIYNKISRINNFNKFQLPQRKISLQTN